MHWCWLWLAMMRRNVCCLQTYVSLLLCQAAQRKSEIAKGWPLNTYQNRLSVWNRTVPDVVHKEIMVCGIRGLEVELNMSCIWFYGLKKRVFKYETQDKKMFLIYLGRSVNPVDFNLDFSGQLSRSAKVHFLGSFMKHCSDPPKQAVKILFKMSGCTSFSCFFFHSNSVKATAPHHLSKWWRSRSASTI